MKEGLHSNEHVVGAGYNFHKYVLQVTLLDLYEQLIYTQFCNHFYVCLHEFTMDVNLGFTAMTQSQNYIFWNRGKLKWANPSDVEL